MRRIYLRITAIIIFTAALCADAAGVFPDDGNSLKLYELLSQELLKEPAGRFSPAYVKKIFSLSDYAGRERTSALFREALEKAEGSGGEGSVSSMLMRLALEEMGGASGNGAPSFRGIERWRLSGPWQRYGGPDIDYPFLPELKAGAVKSRMQRIASAGSRVYPFGFIPERRGVVYAKTSFASGVPFRLWVVSNSGYKLFINGREILRSEAGDEISVSGFTVKGTDGYTLLLKIADNGNTDDPFFRVILTDTGNRPLDTDFTDREFNGRFFAEMEYPGEGVNSAPGFNGAVMADKLRGLVKTGEPGGALLLGKKIITEYPFYGEAYSELVPLLDRMKRDSEFSEYIDLFRKNFPDSDLYLKWEAEFYRTRDAAKCAGIIRELHPRLVSSEAALFYLTYLRDRGNCREAAEFSERYRDIPYFRAAVSETVRSCSGNEAWRKYLIGMIASTGDPFFYYSMGLAEMQAGLDPVLYWEKGLSISGGVREMREMADIYENGMAKDHGFYIGRFTDLYPEFSWGGTRRRVTIRIFENGNFMTECEDIIPGALLEKGSFSLAPLKNLKVLYVVKAKDGVAASAGYGEEVESAGRSIRLKDTAGADFVAVKYTGYFPFEKYPYYITRGLPLKSADEKISELEVEVLPYGTVRPAVSFMGRVLDGEEDESGDLKFSAAGRFSSGEKREASISIKFFSSDREFAAWYGDLLKLRQMDVALPVYPGVRGKTVKETVDNMKRYIAENFKNDGTGNFLPGGAGKVFAERHGSAGELALLSAVILENAGVRSFPAFIRNKKEFCQDEAYMALYIPDSKGRGYWLDFNRKTDGIDNPEALIIKGDSFEIIPVVEEGGD